MQPDHIRVALNWLRAARQDQVAAEELAERLPGVACFHCQQAVEKALKARIVRLAGDAPRYHLLQDLMDELEELREPVPREIAGAARLLEKYYLPTRYPDALDGGDVSFAFSTKEAEAALETVASVIDWVEPMIL